MANVSTSKAKSQRRDAFERLSDELNLITEKWNAIAETSDEPCPAQGMSPGEWSEASELNLILISSDRSFAAAWASAVGQAKALFLDDFTNWAVGFVQLVGVNQFPLDSDDPPHFDAPPTGTIPLSSATTGSSDTLDAGLKVILWAAAYRDPQLCRRDAVHQTMVWNWVAWFLNYGGTTCGTVPDPFQWARQAFHHFLAGEVTAQGTKVKRRKKLDEVNIRVGELLKDKNNRSLRKLAKKSGCSAALVSETFAWRVYAAKLRGGKKPKAVRLTNEMEATLGKNDPALEKLIKEQQADDEGSPLEPARVQHGRRAKV